MHYGQLENRELRSILCEVFAYWMQANKEQIKGKTTWLDGDVVRSDSFDVLFL